MVPVAVALLVYVLVSGLIELDSPEVPAVVEVRANGLLDLLYLVPGTPGLVGSSRLLGFLDRITTTRCIVGRRLGSPWVHNKPI